MQQAVLRLLPAQPVGLRCYPPCVRKPQYSYETKLEYVVLHYCQYVNILTATMFWDRKGDLLLEFIPGDQERNAAAYHETLEKLCVKTRRRTLLARSFMTATFGCCPSMVQFLWPVIIGVLGGKQNIFVGTNNVKKTVEMRLEEEFLWRTKSRRDAYRNAALSSCRLNAFFELPKTPFDSLD